MLDKMVVTYRVMIDRTGKVSVFSGEFVEEEEKREENKRCRR